MRNGEEKESIFRERLRQSISSAYKFYVPSTRKVMLCNQARFDDLFFPDLNQEILEREKDYHSTNILGRVPSGSKWIPYDKTIPSNLYEKVH